MISYSYATDPFEVLIACPSGPNFGANANTITYFIMVTSPNVERTMFEISVEAIPTLTPEQGWFVSFPFFFPSHSHFPIFGKLQKWNE